MSKVQVALLDVCPTDADMCSIQQSFNRLLGMEDGFGQPGLRLAELMLKGPIDFEDLTDIPGVVNVTVTYDEQKQQYTLFDEEDNEL